MHLLAVVQTFAKCLSLQCFWSLSVRLRGKHGRVTEPFHFTPLFSSCVWQLGPNVQGTKWAGSTCMYFQYVRLPYQVPWRDSKEAKRTVTSKTKTPSIISSGISLGCNVSELWSNPTLMDGNGFIHESTSVSCHGGLGGEAVDALRPWLSEVDPTETLRHGLFIALRQTTHLNLSRT